MQRLTIDEVYDIAADLGIEDPQLCETLVEFMEAVCAKLERVSEDLGVFWGIEDAEFEEIAEDGSEGEIRMLEA
tara:strand:+ start:19 stop:240 length:222 start_codon:yes stop_codon:yes gene_type:complete